MNITICKNADRLGAAAAGLAADILRRSIAETGGARAVFSTGASQLETLEHLLREDIDWSRVTAFHLDEYVGLPEDHPAGFRRYLLDRFLSKIPIGQYHLVDGSADCIPELTRRLREQPVDLGLIGIGENAHIAFNDPPADFETQEAYICVRLSDSCKQQQVGEGWFPSPAEVPDLAVSMTVYQIMQCAHIISSVPRAVKAQAIANMLAGDTGNLVPATILKTHPHFSLFLDAESASLLDEKVIRMPEGLSFGVTRL